MKLDPSPNAHMDFFQILKNFDEINHKNAFIQAVHKNILDTTEKNLNNFKDISDDKAIEQYVRKIFSSDSYDFMYHRDLKILKNDHYYYAFNSEIKQEHIILFENIAFISKIRKNPFWCHLNPRVLNKFDKVIDTNLNPHEKIDLELKLKTFFEDEKYGNINKALYVALFFMQKKEYNSYVSFYLTSKKFTESIYHQVLIDEVDLNEKKLLIILEDYQMALERYINRLKKTPKENKELKEKLKMLKEIDGWIEE